MMAVIDTDEKFNLAIAQWQSTQTPPVSPLYWQRDSAARKLFIVTPGNNAPDVFQDITPNTAVLEAALDTASANVAEDALLSESATKKEQARRYLLSQLDNPSSVLTIYNTVRGVIDSNPKFATRINTMNILATGGVPGWTLNLAAIDTDPERKQYLMLVIWLFPIVG